MSTWNFDARRSQRSVIHGLLLLGCLAACGPFAAMAKSPDPPRTQAPTQPAADDKPGYQQQFGDDVLEKFVPKAPRTAGQQARLDALSWYMTGQLREQRNDFTGALEAYKKSVELDPEAIEIYRSLVPLAFSLNQTEDAVKYGLKAVELDPNDYALLRRLGVHLATERDVERALKLFEKAIQSETLDHNSGAYVTLNRDLAVLYSALGKNEQAADAFAVVFDALENPRKYDLDIRLRRALETSPASSYEQIGQVFLNAGRTKLAIRAFETAAKRQNGQPSAISYHLARVYLEDGQSKRALGELQKYFDAQLQSQGRDAYELLADILAKLDQSNELVPRLEKLAEKDARNQKLQYFLAEQYLERNDLDKAADLYKKTLEGVKDAEGYAGLASVYRRQNKPSELLRSLTQAVEAGGGETTQILADELQAIGQDEKLLTAVLDTARSQAADANLDFAGSLVAGRVAVAGKRTDAAIEFYELALKSGRDRAGAIYSELGEYLFDQKEYQKVADWFQRAVDDPAVDGKPNWLFRLSQARALNNETEAALKAVREAQNQLPRIALLHFQEAWIYYMAQDYPKALELFEQLEKRFPEDADIIRRSQYIISNIYVQQGDMRKGEEVLERIYAEDPDDTSVNNDLGYLYADQGKNLEKAKSMIEKALQDEPENAAYLDSMAWVLFKLGKPKEALPYMEKAIAQEDDADATLWDHLGDIQSALSRKKDALESWRKALSQSQKATRPDEKQIKSIQQKIQAAGEKSTDDESP